MNWGFIGNWSPGSPGWLISLDQSPPGLLHAVPRNHASASVSASVFVGLGILNAMMRQAQVGTIRRSKLASDYSEGNPLQRLHVGQPVRRSRQWSISTKG